MFPQFFLFCSLLKFIGISVGLRSKVLQCCLVQAGMPAIHIFFVTAKSVPK